VVVNADVARLVTSQPTVPANISLLSEPQRDEGVANLTSTSQFDVSCNEDVIHENVQLCPFFLKPSTTSRLYWYEVVVVSSLLKCLKNETAFLRNKRLVRSLRET